MISPTTRRLAITATVTVALLLTGCSTTPAEPDAPASTAAGFGHVHGIVDAGDGTVLLGTTRDAAKAIQLFNESEYGGRLLEVRPTDRSSATPIPRALSLEPQLGRLRLRVDDACRPCALH